jgi:hypothetical protein
LSLRNIYHWDDPDVDDANTLPVLTSVNSINQVSISNERDGFSNTALHHAFARYPFDLKLVKHLLQTYPMFAREQNQFLRLPLHYALDRIQISIEALRCLLDAYPDGAGIADVHGLRPYDLAVRWKHKNSVLWLMLERLPKLDYQRYLKLKYGVFGSLAAWASNTFSADKSLSVVNDEEEEEEEEEENDDEDDPADHFSRLTTC